ncbi:NAD(P)/FAD-dependent oxidoreductase [Pseudomonas plecoglossicida]|uniref:NAD(P)/FAD-dependent oxidoreductase n=1 Tax=Pseudomonas plecoglossicida TaxID=70775 RepID=UPI003977A017
MSKRGNLEVAIVGAGIIGVSAAYFLQKLGASVTLIDKSFVGDCIPNLGLSQVMTYCRKTQSSPFTDRGVVLARALAIELGYGESLDNSGDESGVPDQKSGDRPRTVLLSDFARDLAARCRDAGVRVLEADPAHCLLGINNHVRGVDASSGVITADEVVVCAGLQSQMLLTSAGLTLPLSAAENRLGASSARQGIPGVFTGMVPMTPNGVPYVGRPEGFKGLYLGIGHGTNPAAAIAVGEDIAAALCDADAMPENVLLRSDLFVGHPISQSL